MARTVAIGKQDFGSLIENHCFYVDKTFFVKDWWESRDDVTLITRPRRFGKTLTLSMVNCFFSADYAGRSDLFEHLAVWEEEEYRKLQGTYPVIYLSFSRIKSAEYKDTFTGICQILSELYNRCEFLLDHDILTEKEKHYFQSVTDDMEKQTAVVAPRQAFGISV